MVVMVLRGRSNGVEHEAWWCAVESESRMWADTKIEPEDVDCVGIQYNIQWARVHGVVGRQMGKRLLAISKGRGQTMDSRKRGMVE